MASKVNNLIRGTTPTIKITFKTIDPSTITDAYLVLKQDCVERVKADITEATVSSDDISWTLTQRQSFQLSPHKNVDIYCDWKTETGLRGRSKLYSCIVEDTGVDEVF